MNRGVTHSKHVDYPHPHNIKKNLVIISCFSYQYSRDFEPLDKRNIINDLCNYLLFCREVLHLNSSEVVVITDISLPAGIFDGKLILCHSLDKYVSSVKELLITFHCKRFFFFYSGHGTRKGGENWFVIPTKKPTSARLSSYQLMELFDKYLPPIVTCFWFFDCCHSEGMVYLPHRWSSKGKKKLPYHLFNPKKRKIFSFHSSKANETSGFLSQGARGSLFTYSCLTTLTNYHYKGKRIIFPHFLDKLKNKMHRYIVDKKQPVHQPIFITNQETDEFLLTWFIT